MTTNTNSLFSNNESNSNNQNELTGEDSLKLLVGEGKKYATVEDLAKGMVHGQNHITTLEQEATTFKDAQTKQTSIDDILAAIKSGDNTQQRDDNQQQPDPAANDTQQVDIATQIKNALEAQTQSNNAVSNVQHVTDSLGKALGVRANEVYTKVGQELGVNLDELAKTSPEAVIKLCTGQGQSAPQNNSLPRGNHNEQSPAGGELDYKGIQALYKAGGMSREKKFELEQRQALRLGDKFFN